MSRAGTTPGIRAGERVRPSAGVVRMSRRAGNVTAWVRSGSYCVIGILTPPPFFPPASDPVTAWSNNASFSKIGKTLRVPPAPCRAGRSPTIGRLFRTGQKKRSAHTHARKYWRTVGGVSRIFWPCAKKSANERATPRTPPGKGDPRHFSPWGESKLGSLPTLLREKVKPISTSLPRPPSRKNCHWQFQPARPDLPLAIVKLPLAIDRRDS